MTKGDVYRLRAKKMEARMKKATRTDKAVMAKKKKALEDMAGIEDWLDGKPGSQLKNKKRLTTANAFVASEP